MSTCNLECLKDKYLEDMTEAHLSANSRLRYIQAQRVKESYIEEIYFSSTSYIKKTLAESKESYDYATNAQYSNGLDKILEVQIPILEEALNRPSNYRNELTRKEKAAEYFSKKYDLELTTSRMLVWKSKDELLKGAALQLLVIQCESCHIPSE